MKVRLTGVVLDVTQRSITPKAGGDPFRFTEVSVFSEDAASLEVVRYLADYNGQIPGRGEVVDLLVELTTYASRIQATVVKPYPEPRRAAVQPVKSA